ncbi:MAG: serine/threonine-protein kinase [Phycisphaerales bacterium]
MVNSARHERIGALFLEASRLAPELRRAFLESRCEGDQSIVDEVEDLLKHQDAGPVIATGVLDVGAVFDGAVASTPSLGSALSSVARYRIERVLGEGGMGTVYLAEQDRPRRTVALKVMRAALGNVERVRRRFHFEAEVLGRLEHPGIARIYDAGSAKIATKDATAEVPYFAMEYVDGLPLTEYAESNRLGTRDRMRLVARIAEAVGAAHRLGIVHRDLKPQNVLVDRAGQPKVLDFGVARATDGDVAMTTMQTDVGQLIGTLAYMSPEQVGGDPAAIGVRSDVYSLGAVAYELLARRPLVDPRGKSVAEVARVIKDEDAARLSTVDRVFRGDLETIVAKALEKDPSRRYPDATEFAEDVNRYLRDEPISARPPTTMYQLRKFARRNRAVVGGVMAAFVMLILGLVGTSIGFVRALEQTRVAQAEKARADRRFDQVRKLANAFVYDVHDKIVDLPGSTEARKSIVSTALSYLDSLATEAGDDHQLALDLSEAYLKVGQAQGYGSRANLGDREGARKSFLKSVEIRERLVASEPNNDAFRLSLVRARNQVASLDFAQARYAEALAAFEDGLRVRRDVLTHTPDDPARVREVGISHQWIGNVHRAMAEEAEREKRPDDAKKELERALAAYREYIAILESVAKPDDPGSQRDLSVGHEKVGDILGDMGRHDEAIEQFNRSLAIRTKLYEAHPDNSESVADLTAAHGKVGARLLALKRPEDAAPHLQRSYELSRDAVKADPQNVLARTNLVVGEYRLSQLALVRFEAVASPGEAQRPLLDDAVAHANAAIEMLEALDREGKLDESKRSWKDSMKEMIAEADKHRAALSAPASGK